jgi:hypothetical protein
MELIGDIDGLEFIMSDKLRQRLLCVAGVPIASDTCDNYTDNSMRWAQGRERIQKAVPKPYPKPSFYF